MVSSWGLRQWTGVAAEVGLFLAALWFLVKLAGPLFTDEDPADAAAGKPKKT